MFYNIPEQEEGWENCEARLSDIIHKNKLYEYRTEAKTAVVPQFDRVHRIGQKDSKKTRPIIAKLTFFKDKELILNNRSLLKDKKIDGSDKQLVIGEDYCKKTIEIHKLLLGKAKVAKENNESIAKYYVNYRSITLAYDLEGRTTYLKKTYVLKDMFAANWHVLKESDQ